MNTLLVIALVWALACVAFVVMCSRYARAGATPAPKDLTLVVEEHMPCKRGACDCSRYPGVHVGRSPF